MLKYIIVLSLCLLLYGRPVVVNGGQVTINGVLTQTQIDIMINYTANVKWLGIIWSSDEVNTDFHLLQRDEANIAKPVKVTDCHLDQNSHIVRDDVGNLQPSISSFTGDATSGMKIAYNRDLATGDSQDIRFYINQVIQVCFISSNLQFVGDGWQSGHQKICSFMSLHDKIIYGQDRMLGNFATTSLFSGGNLTLYIAENTDGDASQSWLFYSILYKQQGLSPFQGKWLGVTYEDSLQNTDMAIIEYTTYNLVKDVHIYDMYLVNSTFAQPDQYFNDAQGGQDVYKNLAAIDITKYIICSFKRKFTTGDPNRDHNIVNGQHTFCVFAGKQYQFQTLQQYQKICLKVQISTPYFSNFRTTKTDQETVIEVIQPKNVVKVVKYQSIIGVLSYILLILLQ